MSQQNSTISPGPVYRIPTHHTICSRAIGSQTHPIPFPTISKKKMSSRQPLTQCRGVKCQHPLDHRQVRVFMRGLQGLTPQGVRMSGCGRRRISPSLARLEPRTSTAWCTVTNRG
uniref:Uncharacterized protein n=1 Tax=Cacopsylla melanoneura TaxID=428564 RepID=A0A8D8QIR8_9HEMI